MCVESKLVNILFYEKLNFVGILRLAFEYCGADICDSKSE